MSWHFILAFLGAFVVSFFFIIGVRFVVDALRGHWRYIP